MIDECKRMTVVWS